MDRDGRYSLLYVLPAAAMLLVGCCSQSSDPHANVLLMFFISLILLLPLLLSILSPGTLTELAFGTFSRTAEALRMLRTAKQKLVEKAGRMFVIVDWLISAERAREIVNQISCFVLVESWLYKSHSAHSAWLYSLLTYRVLSNYLVISHSTSTRCMSKVHSIFNIVSKVACLTAILSTMVIFSSMNQPMRYIAPTLAYFVLTDKHYLDFYSDYMKQFEMYSLEGLEDLFCEAICRTVAIVFSVAMITLCLASGRGTYIAYFAAYTNVYWPFSRMYGEVYSRLVKEAAMLVKFRRASHVELVRHQDVCPVCLARMRDSARVTPCGHIFHASCLRLCLRQRDACPMCSAKF